MKAFTTLVTNIDSSTKTTVKVQSLVNYFQEASDEDKLWTIALFTHRRPKRPVKTSLLREWASELANIPLWLFEESYHIVGDLAETIALLVPQSAHEPPIGLSKWIGRVIALRDQSEEDKKAAIQKYWKGMNQMERFVFNKILTGGFRIGVSQKLLTKALAIYLEQDEAVVAHRLMGNWLPNQTTFNQLLIEKDEHDMDAKPYPFYLTYALDKDLNDIGEPKDWIAERKWDGIRAQVIVRNKEIYIWSRGEELVTDKYPELHLLTERIDNCVLDGELMAYKDDQPLSFHHLQTRIGRKTVSKKLLSDVPVILMAYDILEYNGKDIRSTPIKERRALLENLVIEANYTSLKLSELVDFKNWKDLELEKDKSRALHCEGLMLKKKDSLYQVGRVKGDWWKWKVEPYTIDAVLTYAMRGHGRRANLYTDYTFGLWENGVLVTFTKAYSGLTDKEILEIDRFVKQNSIQKFGPVRSVKPEIVFELAFEGIAISKRHKSGVAVRFPRIKRIRYDKKIEEANTLDELKALIE
ncbi:MAG: ATP-dependent DNA ligase [Chitinophagales bacterium]